MAIKWTKGYSWGTKGYLPGNTNGMYDFLIYAPGDPCNYTKDGKHELRYYPAKGGIKQSYHANLEAAKRAARRHVEGPSARSRFQWVKGWYKDDTLLKVGGVYKYFVGFNYMGRDGYAVAPYNNSVVLAVFPTKEEAQKHAVKLAKGVK